MFNFLGKLLKKNAAPEAPVGTLQKAAPLPEPEEEVAPPPPPQDIGISKADILQKMWGIGFAYPGTPEFILTLANPLRLDKEKTVVDLHAGLGGAGRLMADKFKTYVNGFEPDAELAALGMEMSNVAGIKYHAPVTAYDPNAFKLDKKVDAIFAREIIYTVADKLLFMRTLSKGMKLRGQLVITDYIGTDELKQSPQVMAWLKDEPKGASLLTDHELKHLISQSNLDLRVTEDLTAVYRKQALMGLARFAEWIKDRTLSSSSKATIGKIVELWAMRLSALDSGVKYMRYNAIKG